MSYELYEGFSNAGDLLKELSEAVKVDSDGGATITLSEIIGIVTRVGIKVAEDVMDTEPEEPTP